MRYLKLFFVAAMVFVVPLAADARPRMAVREFEDKSQDGGAPAAAIMDMMTTELDKAGLFDLMEREKLDYIADEIRLGRSGLMDPSTAPKVGKIKGVQYTMTGAITLYFYNEKANGVSLPAIGPIMGVAESKTAYVDVDIRVIETDSGAIVYSAVERGTAKQESREPGLLNSTYNRTHGGILSAAARDAVMKHVEALRERSLQ